MAFCYILRCAEGSYYVGSTDDLPSRLSKHADGSASHYTAARRPITLVYSEETSSTQVARVLAAAINSTVVAGENPTVGSTVWLPAASVAPGR